MSTAGTPELRLTHLSCFYPTCTHLLQITWVCHLGPVSWRPTTVKWRQSSQCNRHSNIGTRQTDYHEALPSSANVQSHLTSSFADDGNTSWCSVCRVPMVEWRLDCEDCRHLTVVGLHDTGPWAVFNLPQSTRVCHVGSLEEPPAKPVYYHILFRVRATSMQFSILHVFMVCLWFKPLK